MARSTYQQPIKPQIFWDPTSKEYMIKTNFNEAFIQDLKTLCSPTYHATGKLWSVKESEVNDAKTIVEAHFPPDQYGTLDFIPKPDPSKAKTSVTNGHVSPAAKAALTMFEISHYDDAKDVYRLLVKRYEKAWKDPDNCPQEDKDKAAAITRAWKELKQHCGWN